MEAVKNYIDSVSFGSISVQGKTFNYDIVISLDRRVRKRKKKLSKQVFGTSHVISLAEAEFIFEPGAGKLIVGAGHNGMVILSTEAADFFRSKNCNVVLLPTPEAVHVFNSTTGKTIALFHITC